MKSRSKELLERSLAAMVSAIEIYNKPDFAYRAESFTILAVNAWELLLKAKWLGDHKNKLSSLYIHYGGGAKRLRFKKTPAGNPYTHGLDYLANKLRENGSLDERARLNLRILAELRDSSVHFYHNNPRFSETVHEICAAAVKNFHAAAFDWFGEDFSRFNFFLMPLAFVGGASNFEAIILGPEEKRIVRFIAAADSNDIDASSRYSVAVNVELRFVKSQAKDAAAVRLTNDPSAPALRFTEEQIRLRYPFSYDELTAQCKSRYSDFKADRKYHDLRKSLQTDSRYAHVRLLDPKNAKSSQKTFYSSGILERLDQHYTRKL
jgi:Protein of unknown function (DUF3644)/EC042_2821-lke REase